jgi:hypothetical protein
MSADFPWPRVSKDRPCPVCHKPDWCLVAPDGSAAICQRVADGAVKRVGEAGWLHRLHDNRWRPCGPRLIRVPLRKPALAAEWSALAAQFQGSAEPNRLKSLARALHLSVESLRRLGIGWCAASRAWSFPMSDADGRAIGIRLRTEQGAKFSVKGSASGLFIPTDLDTSARLLIAEGPTDTAALLDLGFDAVGRPSCTGGSRWLVELVKAQPRAALVIVADRDPAGQRGAESLASRLALFCRNVRVILPPDTIKDARQWKAAGADRPTIEAAILAVPRRHLSISVRQDLASSGPGGKGARRGLR